MNFLQKLPSGTRVERALRAHRLSRCPRCSNYPPEDVFPESLPVFRRTSVTTPHRRIILTPSPLYVELLSEELAKVENDNLPTARYGPIIWPTKPFDSATADFMSNAVPAG